MPSVSSGPVVYEIPCACGKLLTIAAGQAGSQITCVCGTVVDLPTIRELRRQFGQVGVESSKKPLARDAAGGSESFGRSAMVVFGIGLIIAGLLTFGALYLFQSSLEQDVDPRLFAWMEEQKKQMDKVPPSDLLMEWQFARDKGLGDHNAFPQVINKERAQGAWYGAYVGIAMGVVGVLMLVFAAIIPKRRSGA